MNQKGFALSWGRKMFFGLTWPLICFFGLSYFQSKIFPQSFVEIFYLIVTYIGHYGLITSLLYFVFYAPFAIIFPTYYMTRLWSLFLTLMMCVGIFIDSLIFAQYRIHLNKFLIDLLMDGYAKEIFKFTPSVLIIAVTVFFILIFYFWFQGEKHWRHMQRRFNNTNSNWYFLLIILCLIVSHSMHIYGDAYGNPKIVRHSKSFPLYYPATAKTTLQGADFLPEKIEKKEVTVHDFFYPQMPLNCTAAENKNIVMFLVSDWDVDGFDSNLFPNIFHLSTHGRMISDHRAQSFYWESGLFSIMYGLPHTYFSMIKIDHSRPVLMTEISKRNYQKGLFSEIELQDSTLVRTAFLSEEIKKINNQFSSDIDNWFGKLDSSRPFFLLTLLKPQVPGEIERKVSDVIRAISSRELSSNTLIFITSTNSSSKEFDLRVPLIMIGDDFKNLQFNTFTNHLDLVPTIMKNFFQCDNPVATYSDGQPMNELSPRDWMIAGKENNFLIYDFMKNQILEVDSLKGYSLRSMKGEKLSRKEGRGELILEVLKKSSRFRDRL